MEVSFLVGFGFVFLKEGEGFGKGGFVGFFVRREVELLIRRVGLIFFKFIWGINVFDFFYYTVWGLF